MAIPAKSLFDSSGDNTAQALKASGGNIIYLHVVNPNLVAAYIQLFDVAVASVTVGTTTPKQSFFIPAEGAWDGNFPAETFNFENAITYACTLTATGNGNPTTGLIVNALYR